MRLSGTKTGAINQYRGLGDQLWDLGGARPSLDLNFAHSKDLTDATTGKDYVDFTRASSGTYVGSDGLIKTATTNLLLQSEDFSTTWTSSNLTTIVNQIAAPTGTTTADLTTGNAGTNIKRLRQNVSTTALGPWTFSVWLKTNTAASALIVLLDSSVGGVNNVRTTLTFSTGAVSSGVAAGTATGASASVQNFGNGWYRVSITGTFVTALTSVWAEIWLDGFTSTANETSFYLWGAQLEQSTTVGEYVKTTSTINSAPRFDHDPTTGESLGLLVEEARTNSIRNNTMVGAVAGTPGTAPTNWILPTATGNISTVSIISTGSEDGIVYSDIRVATTGAVNTNIQFEYGVPASNGQTWTGSSYVKLVGGSLSNITTQIRVEEDDSGGAFLGTTDTTFVATTASLITQRYSSTRTNNNASAGQERITIRLAFSGAGDITLRIGMPQLEQGAFATSVIPTSTTAVTRAADVASISGSNFGTFRTNLLQYSEEFDQASWIKSSSTVTANTTASPSGSTTADSLVENSILQQHYAVQNPSISANTIHTATIYVKANTRSSIRFGFLNSALSSGAYAHFNASTGVISYQTTAGTATNVSYAMDAAGSGWYRCKVTCTVDSSSTTGAFFVGLVDGTNNATYTGDGTSGIYIWGAQLEQGSTATDYIKSDVNWTSRASNATYYDVNGTLKKSSYNLLLQSEDFSTTWTPTGLLAFGSGSTVNATQAPDGLIAADLLTEDTSNGAHHSQQSATIASGVNYTFSVYIKASGRSAVRLRVGNPSGDFAANFDLSTITASNGAGSGNGTYVSAGIQEAGNGWYRCFIVGSQTSTSTNTRVALLDNSSNTAALYTGDGTSGIYLWGAQLETGTYAGDYAKTTTTAASTARTAAYLPDGNGNFVSAGPLLLEAAGTNLLLQSEDFSTTWGKPASVTVTANQAISPDGSLTADLIEGTGNDNFINQSVSLVSGTTYTISVYAKSAGLSKDTFRLGGDSIQFSGSNFTATSSWQRFEFTFTATATGARNNFITRDSSNNPLGIYVWGAQLEQSSYPTSYIPTTTSTATRAADVSTSAATTVFESDWYRQEEGTFFADALISGASNETGILGVTNAGETDFLRLSRLATTSHPRALVFDDSSAQSDTQPTNTITVGQQFRVATVLRANDFATVLSGGAFATDTSGTIPTVDRMTIGTGAFLTQLNGTIRRLTYWPARLPNETLQTITN